MILRAISALLAATTLLLVLAAPGVSQDLPRSADDLCNKPDPGRAIKLALDSDNLIVAIVQATGPRNLDTGTSVRVIRVVEGTLDAREALADRQPTLECLSEGVWIQGQPVVGVFLVADGTLSTLAAWPFLGDRAVLNGERLTVEELLELGRTFVEPTPTPLPPGVPRPPTLVPPDSGGPQRLPSTGGDSGAHAPDPGAHGPDLRSVGLAIGALASLGGAWFLSRRRRA